MSNTPLSQPRKSIPTATVWAAAIAATLISILVYVALTWVGNKTASPATASLTMQSHQVSGKALAIIGILTALFIVGPGLLVALIVLPIIHKKK